MPKMNEVHRARKQRRISPEVGIPGEEVERYQRVKDLRRIGGGEFFGAPVRLSSLGMVRR
ncbi:MAG: hypothetical protein AAF317_09725 [Pseudomonadota bacterium]